MRLDEPHAINMRIEQRMGVGNSEKKKGEEREKEQIRETREESNLERKVRVFTRVKGS